MFIGSTPKEVRILIQDIIAKAKGIKSIYIGCSGNFTIDKVCSKLGYKVHSNDVSLYSKLIADILLNEETFVDIVNPELKQIFANWSDSKYKKLIQVMYAIKISEFVDRKNDYQKMFFDSWVDQSQKYYLNSINKLEKGAFDFQIASFSFCDFVDHLKNTPANSVGISFPPTYKAGYEKIFNFVEKSFDYERAKYNMFDPKDAGILFEELLESGKQIIYSDKDWKNITKFKVGSVNLGQGKHPVFIYSSLKGRKKYYIERDSQVLDSKIKVIPVDFEFKDDTKITCDLYPVKDINYFKAFFMGSKVNYTTGGDMGLIFFADGRAFGFTSFSKTLSTIDEIFVQSDFVVFSNVPKLSKLLIMLTKSNEVRHTVCRKLGNYYEGLKTTVYTTKAVSMKYRGVYTLEKRFKDKLIYTSKFNNLSLIENYQIWKTKKK